MREREQRNLAWPVEAFFLTAKRVPGCLSHGP